MLTQEEMEELLSIKSEALLRKRLLDYSYRYDGLTLVQVLLDSIRANTLLASEYARRNSAKGGVLICDRFLRAMRRVAFVGCIVEELKTMHETQFTDFYKDVWKRLPRDFTALVHHPQKSEVSRTAVKLEFVTECIRTVRKHGYPDAEGLIISFITRDSTAHKLGILQLIA